MSSLAQTSLEKSVRLPHVRDVIMYVCPLFVACSLVGLIGEPQRLKPPVSVAPFRRGFKPRPFKATSPPFTTAYISPRLQKKESQSSTHRTTDRSSRTWMKTGGRGSENGQQPCAQKCYSDLHRFHSSIIFVNSLNR